ncbi:MAG: tyrosine-type recombinase/integrase [Bacteroides uniformis]
MATTFTFELNSKPNKAGKYAVLLRITQDRKLKRLKTSIALNKKSDWNSKKKEIRQSEPNYAKWNEILEQELETVKSKYRELREDGLATAERIKDEVTASEKTFSFLQYARKKAQEIYDEGGIRNWKKHRTFCNKIEAYQKDKKGNIKDLTFKELTPTYLSQFASHLRTLRNERKSSQVLHPNTVQTNLNIFRALVNKAISEGLMKNEQNPFHSFKYRGVPTLKEKLNTKEIAAIEALDLFEGSLIWNCRNFFLFSFYCAGIRVGDLLQLRWCNIASDNRISYQMGKNHKARDFVLVSQAQEILQHYHSKDAKPTDYIFPMLNNSAAWARAITQEEKDVLPAELKKALFDQIEVKTALINKELKKIALRANISKKLSFHISRHSFAKVAKQKRMDNSIVKDLLAHSNMATTERYMGSFDTEENDKALESLFESKKPSADVESLLQQLQSLSSEERERLIEKIK